MLRWLLWLLLLLPLAQAKALEVIVFDPSLQRVVGQGSSVKHHLVLRLLASYSGPVQVLVLRGGQDIRSVPGSLDHGVLRLGGRLHQSLAAFLRGFGLRLKIELVRGKLSSRAPPGFSPRRWST
jgi:hypothetical protein